MSAQSRNIAIDIFLQPGEFHFAGDDTRIRTVLGSCVSMVFWHPALHVGGMCHYMLPFRADRHMGDLDGRYADEAMAMMFREMRQIGTRPAEYEVKIFGGANMFPEHHRKEDNVGTRNVDAARDIIEAHGLRCVAEHTAGIGHRNVIFDISSGHVWVRHQPLMATERHCSDPPATSNLSARERYSLPPQARSNSLLYGRWPGGDGYT